MAKPIVVTHSGDFHADDVFAVATLRILLGECEVKRSREAEVIASGDYVVDVGGIYNAESNRFDHHQEGGAGERENGIPYAAFGLVWKHYGAQITGNADIAHRIDESFIQAMDALDNGVEITTPIHTDVFPHSLNGIVAAYRPTWKEDNSEETYHERFMTLVPPAEYHLKRLISITGDYLESHSLVEEQYQKAADKRFIVLDKTYPWKEVLMSYPEPLYVVYPRSKGWGVKAVPKDVHTFENRKDLPAAWAGKRNSELAAITGVPDAIFCHNKRFLAVAESKEGALALVQKAIE